MNIYRDHFGVDDFFHEAALSFSQQGPLVSLICLNCADSEIDEFLSRQLYANLEVVRTTPDNSFADIIDYISSANSKYLCFFEPNHRYDSSKIFDMVYSLESLPSVDLLICARYYSDKAGDIIAPSELPYSKEQPDVILDGTSVLQNSINEHRNLFGKFHNWPGTIPKSNLFHRSTYHILGQRLWPCAISCSNMTENLEFSG